MRSNSVVRDRVRQLVDAAVLAPSIHNTQPWLFTLTGDALELHADATRHLRATDPDGRQLRISCGAALYNARLALRCLGRAGDILLFPDERQPDLLARLADGDPHLPTDEERRLLAALPRRRTQRGAFEPREVDRGLLVELQRAAWRERATLHLLEHPGHRRAVADLVSAADRAQHAHPHSRREMLEWTPEEGEHRRDGVPASAYPRFRTSGPDGTLPVRDFDAGRRRGTAEPAWMTVLPEAAMLLTPGDRPVDHLRAGMAMQHVLVLAAASGVQATMHSQPIGVNGLRSALREAVPSEGTPQMLLQLGHATAGPPTPRRPVSAVLDRALHPVG